MNSNAAVKITNIQLSCEIRCQRKCSESGYGEKIDETIMVKKIYDAKLDEVCGRAVWT
jgi:hypothetical protein